MEEEGDDEQQLEEPVGGGERIGVDDGNHAWVDHVICALRCGGWVGTSGRAALAGGRWVFEVLDEGGALGVVQLEIGHEREDAGEVLEGICGGLGVGDNAGEELVVGMILVAHGAVVFGRPSLPSELFWRGWEVCWSGTGIEVGGERCCQRSGSVPAKGGMTPLCT